MAYLSTSNQYYIAIHTIQKFTACNSEINSDTDRNFNYGFQYEMTFSYNLSTDWYFNCISDSSAVFSSSRAML